MLRCALVYVDQVWELRGCSDEGKSFLGVASVEDEKNEVVDSTRRFQS